MYRAGAQQRDSGPAFGGNRRGIRHLAEHLDISIGTVSRALNGRPDVNAETRKRVLEAASRDPSPNRASVKRTTLLATAAAVLAAVALSFVF